LTTTSNASSSKAASSIGSTTSSVNQSSSAPNTDKNSTDEQKSVTVNWGHPSQRVNGSFLELDEIAGYELRFKQTSSSNFTYLKIEGNSSTHYVTTLIPAGSLIEIAVYDTNGVYSDFTAISATSR
jgi:hypothetical protein